MLLVDIWVYWSSDLGIYGGEESMRDEILIIERSLTDMSFVMNILPGDEARMKNSETLLILQRRMEVCDLQRALSSYNEIFTKPDRPAWTKIPNRL